MSRLAGFPSCQTSRLTDLPRFWKKDTAGIAVAIEEPCRRRPHLKKADVINLTSHSEIEKSCRGCSTASNEGFEISNSRTWVRMSARCCTVVGDASDPFADKFAITSPRCG